MLNTTHTDNASSEEEIWKVLHTVTDPEIPVLTITDMGIVRKVSRIPASAEHPEQFSIAITPTYSGCPAMDMIAMNIKLAMAERGWKNITIEQVLSPAWTTDWMTEEGKQKLKEYGIAPPNKKIVIPEDGVECPRCHSQNTQLISEFGSTACKALYQCRSCLEPFDYFKCH